MTTMSQEKMTLSLEIDEADLDHLLEKEWLLTNSRGSYSSGTVVGCNTRRYHGLLVASLHPPVERMVALSNTLEVVQYRGATHELSNFEFSDRLHPQGYRHLKYFRRGCGVHFIYQFDGIEIERSIYLDYDRDQLLIRYQFRGLREPLTFKVVPMVALRDFHGTQSSATALQVQEEQGVVTARALDPNGPALHLYSPHLAFDSGTDWWYAMRYRVETARGQHDYEDVWVPGIFSGTIAADTEVTLTAGATRALENSGALDFDTAHWIKKQNDRLEALYRQAGANAAIEKELVRAADQFVVRRQINGNRVSTSILAGYHWFADWGRDTFIALPGLLLATRRYDEALEVLTTFGSVIDGGQIPNRFDDYGGPPHYNSIDASLWFVDAAWQYLQATGDRTRFDSVLRPMILAIVRAYGEGTRDGICEEEDGLITGGSHETQLTWMDAKCNGVAFTPRYGKAVEINALWFNALSILKETSLDGKESTVWTRKANRTKASFAGAFWNSQGQYLNDCVYPDGGVDQGVRPNQIFAVSLPFSPLNQADRKAVVARVDAELLTPYGLRSLSPADGRYRGVYRGDQFQRDSAYHQGTVWGFLIGPFVEAYLNVNKHSAKARANGAALLQPLLEHLMAEGCLGSVSEIFAGDFPHRPNGCIAQAWSVAELLRAYRLVHPAP